MSASQTGFVETLCASGVALSVLILLCGGTGASTYTWTGDDSNQWNDPGNWKGAAGTPDDSYDTAIVNIPNPVVMVDASTPAPPPPPDYVKRLEVSNGGKVSNDYVDTNRPMLHVREVTISEPGSQLFVFSRRGVGLRWSGPVFWARDLAVEGGGVFHLADSADVEIGGIDVRPGGTVRGSGTIELFGSVLSLNEGSIVASGSNSLVISQKEGDGSTIDLDGTSESGHLEASRDSMLVISAPLPPVGSHFDGTIRIDQDGQLRILTDWTLGSTGVMDMWGNAGDAVVSGNPLTIEGTANVKSGIGTFAPPVTVQSGGEIDVASGQVASFSETVNVRTNGLIDFHVSSEGTFHGSATAQMAGKIQFSRGATGVFYHGAGVFDNGLIELGNESDVDIYQTATVRDTGSTIHVREDATLDTHGALYVYDNGTVNVDSSTGRFNNHVTVRGGGTIELNGEAAGQFGSTLLVEEGGVIDVGNASTVYFNGPTTIASSAGDLDLNRSATMIVNDSTQILLDEFDWDGAASRTAGAATSTIVNGSLSVVANHIDTGGVDRHDSEILVRGDLSVNVADGEWQANGVMTLMTGSLSGDTLSLTGQMYISGAGLSTTDAPIHFDDGGRLNVLDGSRLRLDSGARFEPGSSVAVDGGILDLDDGSFYFTGGSIGGSGELEIDSRVFISGDTQWDNQALDWDGQLGRGTTKINTGNSLTVNGVLTDAYSSTVTVDSGSLTVTNDWAMDRGGVLAMDNRTGTPVLNGGTLTLQDGSEITVRNGPADIRAHLVLEQGSRIRNLNAIARAELHGGITLAGGELVEDVSGTAVRLLDAATVTGHSAVDITSFDWAHAPTTLNPGSSLTIDVANFGQVGDRTYNSILSVNSAAIDVSVAGGQWQLGRLSEVNLDASEGAASLAGATLVVPHGRLRATGGASNLDAPLRVESGGTISVPGAGDRLQINGPAEFLGGKYTGDGTIQINNNLTVNVGAYPTVVSVGHFDMDGASGTDSEIRVAPGAELRVNAETIGNASNTFEDTLVIEPDAQVAINTAARKWIVSQGRIDFHAPPTAASLPALGGGDVILIHDAQLIGSGRVLSTLYNTSGSISPGLHASATGTVLVGTNYSQGEDGTLLMEIGEDGRVLVQDQLQVQGAAALDGDLRVKTALGYLPPTIRGAADVFELMTFLRRIGHFATVSYNGTEIARDFTDGDSFRDHLGNGAFRLLRYQEDSLQLINYLAIPGDADGDGVFGPLDLIAVLKAAEYDDLVKNNSDWTEGDWNGDGEFNAKDLVAALSTGRYNQRPLLATSVPEPNSLVLIILGMLMMGCVRA